MTTLHRRKNLVDYLESLTRKYHRTEYLDSDPLEFVHQFQNPHDQEVVALLSSLLAYGRVVQIRASVFRVLSLIGALEVSPSELVFHLAKLSEFEKAKKHFKNFVHRFNSGIDLVILLKLLSMTRGHFKSLGSHFAHYLPSETCGDQDDPLKKALSMLLRDWKNWARPLNPSRGFYFLLSSPESGSTCKRWCMFLRWMGRKDHIDPGLWTQNGALADTIAPGQHLRPDQLIVPLDTHVARISRYLGLTERKTNDWKCAVEVTDSLKKCDPKDPTKYDFAISRLGILNLCQKKYQPSICKKCDLLPVCRYAHSCQ